MRSASAPERLWVRYQAGGRHLERLRDGFHRPHPRCWATSDFDTSDGDPGHTGCAGELLLRQELADALGSDPLANGFGVGGTSGLSDRRMIQV